MLKQRVITAAILIPLVVWGVFGWPAWLLALVFGTLILIGSWEWLHFFGRPAGVARLYPAVTAASLVAGYMAAAEAGSFAAVAILGAAAVWWCLALVWIWRQRDHEPVRNPDGGTGAALAGLAVGLLILVPPFVAVFVLAQWPAFGRGHLLFALTLLWVADSAAYFSGRRWGRRKLAAGISPGKSCEGALGALGACTLWAGAGGWLMGYAGAAWWAFVALSLLVVVFSIVGDLLESLFKRKAGVKDSGRLLPGHGGVLDRVDSLTAGLPIFAFGLILITG